MSTGAVTHGAPLRLWRRVLKWVGIGVGTLLGLVILLLLFVLGTEPGGRLLVSVIQQPRTPLAITEFKGRLIGRFELHGVRLAAPPVSASVERLAMAWHPFALLKKRLVIDTIEVSGVDAQVGKAAPKTEPKPAPADSVPKKIALPIPIELGELRIARAHVQVQDQAKLDLAELRAGGGLEQYWLRLGGQVSARMLDSAQVGLALHGGSDHADIDTLAVAVLDGHVLLAGHAAWWPALSWDVRAAADSLAPGQLLKEPAAWPGAMSFKLQSTGRIARGEPQVKVAIADLGGHLRGYPVSGNAELALAGQRLDIEAIQLAWGAAGLRIAGRVAETVDLTFGVDTSDLGVAIPDARGVVKLAGKATGARTAPRLELGLAADSVLVAGNRVGAIRSNADLSLSKEGTIDLRLAARGIAAKGKQVDSLTVTARGSARAHELATHARGDSLGLVLDLEVAGGLQDSTWQGQIRRLALDSKLAGPWDLARPAAVKASKSAASIADFCLVSTVDSVTVASGAKGPPSLCLDGNWVKAGASQAHLELTALPLARLGRALPAGWSLRGVGELKADATVAADTRIDGHADLTLAGGALTIALADTTDTIAFESKLAATAGAGGVKADLQSQLERAGAAFGELKGEVALSGLTRLTSLSDSTIAQPLKGDLQLTITDLTPLALLSPDIEHLEGAFDVTATARGTLKQPEVAAKAVLKDGAADLPKAGLQLRQIQLTASGDQTKKIDVESTLVSNGGQLAVTAQSLPAPKDSLRLAVQIEGERFVAMNTPEIQVCISPDLEAQVAGRNVDVKGEVKIPYTRIELKQIPPSAQGVSDDVQFVDAEAKEEKPPLLVNADVRVTLGDSVSFKGYGFSSDFGGGLRVIEVPGQPTSATGELRVEHGRYQAYGQDLTIGTWGDSLQGRGDPGRIIFTGGRADNPGLNMRAFREAEDGTVAGLHILGTAKRPEITLFSDPAMPEADALSYIMLGHKAGEGGGDSDMLAKAAVGMGLSRSNVMARSLGSKVGLDEAGIQTSGGLDEASFVTGKYLSPKLYVSHGYGLFDRVSTFRARYLLKKEVTVQAETGKGSGGDVLYRLERGH